MTEHCYCVHGKFWPLNFEKSFNFFSCNKKSFLSAFLSNFKAEKWASSLWDKVMFDFFLIPGCCPLEKVVYLLGALTDTRKKVPHQHLWVWEKKKNPNKTNHDVRWRSGFLKVYCKIEPCELWKLSSRAPHRKLCGFGACFTPAAGAASLGSRGWPWRTSPERPLRPRHVEALAQLAAAPGLRCGGPGGIAQLGPTLETSPEGQARRGRTHRSAGSAGSLAPAGRSAEGRQERRSVRTRM